MTIAQNIAYGYAAARGDPDATPSLAEVAHFTLLPTPFSRLPFSFVCVHALFPLPCTQSGTCVCQRCRG